MSKINNKNLLNILIIYLILSIPLILTKYLIYKNIINLLFWLLIIIYIIYYHKHNYIRNSFNKKYYYIIITILIITTEIELLLGTYIGFTKSPYTYHFNSILFNIYTKIIPIIGLELSRNILIKKNNSKLIIIFITIILILLEINYHNIYINILSKEYFFKYLCSNIIPLIANNILYTYLINKTPYHLVLLYRFIEQLLILFIPITPNFNWFIIGTTSVIKAIIIYIIFNYLYIKEKHHFKFKKSNSFILISYAFTLLFATFLVSFMLGLFKYEPLVILSNSMSPTYKRGDIIILEKLDSNKLNNLSIGTIIIYKSDNKYIAHRIIQIKNIGSNKLYITKGDNNNTNDNKEIEPKDIKGIYKFNLKYLGYPSIYLHDFLNN